jgi:hypothetical protein
MPRTRLRLVLLSFGALALACSSKGGGGSTGTTGGPGGTGATTSGGSSTGATGGVTGGQTGGTSGGRPACQDDADCLATGMRCAGDGGCTLPAQTCDPKQGSSNCSNDSYCWPDGINTNNDCYCHPLLDGGGLCYVQSPPCAPCTEPLDCGTPDQDVDQPATCGQLASGTGSYCLPLYLTGNCPQGFIPGVTDGGSIDVCVPSCGTCPCSGCTSDADCKDPMSGVCNARGVCQAPCQVASDCPSGQVCNVLGKYLDPSLGTLYAAGKCGPACTQSSDCTQYQEGASVPLICDADAGSLCRPAGCLHDTDCTGDSAGDYVAWCDIWSQNQCVDDSCRLGQNPINGGPFDDCVGGYACALPDGGAPGSFLDGGAPILGACFQIPCNEVKGGAHVDCTAGQLCCGEGDAGTSCGGASVGECYPEPIPPWCQTCDPNNGTYFSPDCAAVNDGYPGAVACLTAPSVKHSSPWCGPACNPDELWTCPAGWDCDRQPYLATDCTTCLGACLDAGQVQGTPVFQCGCGGLVGCPAVPQALYEGTSCAACPGGDAGCVPAADGTGFNCTCTPGGAACPPYQFGGQSFPTTCANEQGTNVCVAYVPMLCENSVCDLGYNCESTAFGCPDGG